MMHKFEHPVMTELKPMKTFYEAEDKHKNYFERNPTDSKMNSAWVQKKFENMNEFSLSLNYAKNH